jgi:hypothetical protein
VGWQSNINATCVGVSKGRACELIILQVIDLILKAVVSWTVYNTSMYKMKEKRAGRMSLSSNRNDFSRSIYNNGVKTLFHIFLN